MPHIDGDQSLYCRCQATTGLGHLDVSINPDCKLLLLALDKNMFSATQQGIKGIGGTSNVADAVMLAMAKTAASRIS